MRGHLHKHKLTMHRDHATQRHGHGQMTFLQNGGHAYARALISLPRCLINHLDKSWLNEWARRGMVPSFITYGEHYGCAFNLHVCHIQPVGVDNDNEIFLPGDYGFCVCVPCVDNNVHTIWRWEKLIYDATLIMSHIISRTTRTGQLDRSVCMFAHSENVES